jgi:Neuraminidase (sialidase)
MYDRGLNDQDRPPLTIWQSISSDGGLTWGPDQKILDIPDANPNEPAMIRSPDGKQILAFIREETGRYNSLYIISNDEGETWSKPAELSASLTGHRHLARYAPDGRLVVAFRDMATESPTHGHFVAWVGTYDDVLKGSEGQYRALLLRQRGALNDCGYPGLEVLPDGTFVATTYVAYQPGGKNSIISVRFTLPELDKKLPSLSK